MNTPRLALVIPTYNEEEVLNETIKRLIKILDNLVKNNKIKDNSFMLFIDDGSSDKTWEIIENKSNNFVKGLKLSRNQGHQNALLAGMEFVNNKCDCMISLDADLQDDVETIENMVNEYLNGIDVVYGVRSSRENDTFFKKATAEGFYKFMKFMGVDIVYNHADYRLLSHRALLSFLQFKESNLFIRGIVPLIGLKSSKVYYERHERFAGESKYPLSKMLSFAFDGITSFSTIPLRVITVLGFLTFLLSLIMGGYVLFIALFTDRAVPGWASTVLPIYFIGGIQVLSIGIVGEYIGKIYKETKNRPKYFIEKDIGFDK